MNQRRGVGGGREWASQAPVTPAPPAPYTHSAAHGSTNQTPETSSASTLDKTLSLQPSTPTPTHLPRPLYVLTRSQIGAASLFLCDQPNSLNDISAHSLPCVIVIPAENLLSPSSSISVIPASSRSGVPSPFIRSLTVITVGALCLVKLKGCGKWPLGASHGRVPSLTKKIVVSSLGVIKVHSFPGRMLPPM